MKKIIGLCMVLLLIVAGCSSDKEGTTTDENQGLIQMQESYDDDDMPVAVMETNYGTIAIVLFSKQAPKAVENFIGLVEEGYYDGTIFHRVMQDFMIQGGDPTGSGSGGESIWGKDFGVEISDELYHFKGALAMAKRSDPVSQSSQFYIVQSSDVQTYDDTYKQATGNEYSQEVKDAYAKVGGASFLDGSYTVFGQTIQGLDVLDTIARVEKEMSASGELSTPIEPVQLISVKMTTYGEYK